MHARRLIERLSRGRTFWRRLPAPFSAARVLVTPDAALAVLKPGNAWVDQELLTVATSHVHPGDVVWDIGANLGIFSVASALRAGTAGSVLALEPDIFLAGLVRKTAAALPAGCAGVAVLPAAVSGAAGLANFQIAERGRASNSLEQFGGRSQAGGVREKVPVPIVTLDGLLAISAPPKFIKIDVEGAEGEILLGATEILTKVRPAIYIEVGEQNCQAVTRQLLDARYELFSPDTPVATQQPLPRCLWNTLALPARDGRRPV
jgi:FkbM family methyltransferase